MIADIFKPSKAFIAKKRKHHITIHLLKTSKADAWLKKQSKALQDQARTQGFAFTLFTEHKIYAKVGDDVSLFDGAKISDALFKHFDNAALKNFSFEFSGLSGAKDLEALSIGWGWAYYAFEGLKSKRKNRPVLIAPKAVEKKHILSAVDSVNILRDLVNLPANLLGPDELEIAVRTLAKSHDAKVKVIKDKGLLDKNFPLIYTVGQASPRRPRLIELNWGKAKAPKLTLVGKGVVFDTGGLDLKPSQYMRHMKKDMGGAAHALALAKMVMDHKLPVRLRLLIPAVENAVAGNAFRPGDIIQSRKGLYVENTNTDAEGRLILADTLTYASENKPDLIIDFATLTGSARAGLGPDIPAFFSNDEKTYQTIQTLSRDAEDPVWPMPLWKPYRKHIEASTGDLVNSAGLPGDLIYSALFLESFIEHKTPWMHLDCYAWEQSGRPGRPKGAADTGMRAMFAYLQRRYG